MSFHLLCRARKVTEEDQRFYDQKLAGSSCASPAISSKSNNKKTKKGAVLRRSHSTNSLLTTTPLSRKNKNWPASSSSKTLSSQAQRRLQQGTSTTTQKKKSSLRSLDDLIGKTSPPKRHDQPDDVSSTCHSESLVSTPTTTMAQQQYPLERKTSRDTSCGAPHTPLKIKTQQESLQRPFNPNALLTATSATNTTRSIQFSTVTCHYHDLIMGDHPDVVCGVPIMLGGPCAEDAECCMTLADHERHCQARIAQYGPWQDRCKLSAKMREQMLVQAGVPFQCIRHKINCIKVQNNMALRSRILSNLKDSKRLSSSSKPCCD